jgi:hypothetical protein
MILSFSAARKEEKIHQIFEDSNSFLKIQKGNIPA